MVRVGHGDALQLLRHSLGVVRPHLVVPTRTDTEGVRGPTPGRVRRGWRRTSRGLYVPAATSRSAEQRVVEVAAALAGHPALITGWASLLWRGARWFEGTDEGVPLDVPVMVSTFDRRPQPGVHYSAESWRAVEEDVVDGVRVATAPSAVGFTARHARSHLAAVTVIDMAAFDDLVSIEEMRLMAARSTGRTGVGRLRAAIASAEENAWSPREVPLRLLWSDAVGVSLLCNAPVFDGAGRHVATVDLIDPAAGVVGEYDGVVHLDIARRRTDLRSEERLRDLGLVVVRFVGGMPDAEKRARLHAAYKRAARMTPQRRWSTEPPPWWRDTSTVAARRALSSDESDRLLRYRAA